jgi:hypothetical protein
VYNNLVSNDSKKLSQRLCGLVILPAMLAAFIPGPKVAAKQLSVATVADNQLSVDIETVGARGDGD